MKALTGLMVVGTMMVAGSAMAQTTTATGTGTVAVGVAGRCLLDAPFAIAFGSYDVFTNETADLDAADSVTYRCTKGVTTHKVFLSANSGTMSNGTDTLAFNLYSDSGRATAFPTTSATGVVGTGTLGVQGGLTVPVYGRVPMNQDVSSGSYTGDVTVTVQW